MSGKHLAAMVVNPGLHFLHTLILGYDHHNLSVVSVISK